MAEDVYPGRRVGFLWVLVGQDVGVHEHRDAVVVDNVTFV